MFIMFIGQWKMKKNKVSWKNAWKNAKMKKCQIYKVETKKQNLTYKAKNLGL